MSRSSSRIPGWREPDESGTYGYSRDIGISSAVVPTGHEQFTHRHGQRPPPRRLLRASGPTCCRVGREATCSNSFVVRIDKPVFVSSSRPGSQRGAPRSRCGARSTGLQERGRRTKKRADHKMLWLRQLVGTSALGAAPYEGRTLRGPHSMSARIIAHHPDWDCTGAGTTRMVCHGDR